MGISVRSIGLTVLLLVSACTSSDDADRVPDAGDSRFADAGQDAGHPRAEDASKGSSQDDAGDLDDAGASSDAAQHEHDAALHDSGSDNQDAGADAATPLSAWTADEIVTTADNSVGRAEVVLDAAGNAYLLWSQTGAEPGLWAARAPAGSTNFTDAARIDGPDNRSSAWPLPSLGLAADGDRLAVWQEDTGAASEIWWNHFVSGKGWSTAARVGDAGERHMLPPAMNDSGDAALLWSSSTNEILMNRYDGETRTWGSDQCVWCAEQDDAGMPLAVTTRTTFCGLAMTSIGEVWAVMQFDDGETYRFEARHQASDGYTWDAVEEIASGTYPTGVSRFFCEAGLSPSGDLFVQMEEVVADAAAMTVRKREATSATWSAPHVLDTAPNIVSAPTLTVDASGHALAYWVSKDEHDVEHLRASHYGQSGGWTGAHTLGAAGSSLLEAAMAGDDLGVAAWTTGGSERALMASRYDGIAFSEPETLSVVGGPRRVAVNAKGDAIAVWNVAHTSGLNRLHARRTN